MADRQEAGDIEAPGDSVRLPDPDAGLLPAAGGDSRDYELLYFDPEKWDAEITRLRINDEDPVATERGRVEGQASAALFLSDFHLADGTAGGDDFLESHLHPDEDLGGLYTGFFPPGESRSLLCLSVFTFAMQRLAARAGNKARLDIVLDGDVINFLALKGRGGTYVSGRHAPLFRGLAALRERATVCWLRGNHDYVVPSGPWQGGEYYANPSLRVLAEHGDFWDKENWPPGPTNNGSRLVIELGAAYEVRASVTKDGIIKYLMSGLDNIRPWSNPAIQAFLDRRAKYSDVAALSALLARLKFLGAADDSVAYHGAQQRRKGKYADWLMVQGHTHVPAAQPGAYYNLGTWITTLVAVGRKEVLVEAFPFLLVYLDADDRRIEEYYFVLRPSPGAVPRVVLQSPESVTELRKSIGYKPLR